MNEKKINAIALIVSLAGILTGGGYAWATQSSRIAEVAVRVDHLEADHTIDHDMLISLSSDVKYIREQVDELRRSVDGSSK